MNRKNLIDRIAKRNPHLYRSEIEFIADEVFNVIYDAMLSGETMQLRHFGSFRVKHRPEKIGRNVYANVPVYIPPRKVIHFKASPVLLKHMNGTYDYVSRAKDKT
jgi:nucleoid DNA-binding protein